MLDKRKGRKGGGGGSGSSTDDWDAPPLVKAQMALEIVWFCLILYLITLLLKVMHNVPSRQRQPYILLLISAIFLDISLIMRAVLIRIDDITIGPTDLALSSTVTLLRQQSTCLITMAGLWVFRKRSQLITYGKGAQGIPYAGQTWKFVVDWTVTSCGLLFLLLAVIVNAVGYSLYYSDMIFLSDYRRFVEAQNGLMYVLFAFYFILTIVFVVTGAMLSGAFKRQTGRPDVVTRQMLIWVMPWLIIRALETLVGLIINGMDKRALTYDPLALALAIVIVNGVCWCGMLYGFFKTASDPGPWDWSHLQAHQPQMAPYSVQVVPAQPSNYAPPFGPPQGWWGQNNNPH